MALKVDICEEALGEINRWGLPPSVYSWLLTTIQKDLSERRSDAIGELRCVAPFRLRNYAIAKEDSSGDFLHNFVFIVGDEKLRRVVWSGEYRTSGHDFS